MDRIDDLLEKTSRTFALSIPLLPEPTRRELAIAYLLFRIADTFEDAAAWQPERQIGALDDFIALLESPSAARAAEPLEPPNVVVSPASTQSASAPMKRAHSRIAL